MSYHATVSHAGARQDGAQLVTQTGSQQTGSQRTGSQRTGSQRTGSQQTGSQQTGSQQTGSQQTGSRACRRCRRPASASFDIANVTAQVVKPINHTKNFRFMVKTLEGARASTPQHLRGAAIPGADKR